MVYEIVLNFFRTIVMFILFMSNFDLRTMIYFTLLVIIMGVFIEFKDVNIDKYKVVDK